MADDQVNVQVTADTSSFEDSLQRACTAADANFKALMQSTQATNVELNALGPAANQNLGKAKQSTDDWAKSFASVQRAFNTSITGMILGTTTWQKAVQRVTQTLLSDQINFALKWLEAWVDKEIGATAATQTGATTRGQIETASHVNLLGDIAEALAQWLGLETGKTAATTAGNTARTTADAAARAASAALAIAQGLGQIQIDAAVAAAGAMAAISAIPFVGPALAPEVAAATYATTMGFATGLGAGLVSAAGGLWNVPADTLAMVHKQETIIPASIAQPMRDFFSGGSSGGGGDSYAITVQAIDSRSGAQFLMDNAGAIAKSLAREMRNGNSVLRSAR